MKTLVWMLGYAIGYHMGFGDGLRWGRLRGSLEAFSTYVGARVRESNILPPPTGKRRRGWSWKGRV